MERPSKGIIVDGFCLGNPGKGGYKGIDLETGNKLFYREYPYITNNLAEFIGICHAVMFIKKNKTDQPIVYSDSVIGIEWFKKQKTNSGINYSKGKQCMDDITKILRWLSEQKRTTEVLKWETKLWGENPADFGNKR